MTSSYYRGAQAVVLGKLTLSVPGWQRLTPVYDVTARETFDELLRWLKEIDTYCAEGVVKCLVGNKIDRVGLLACLRRPSPSVQNEPEHHDV